ncbi:FUSC family protein [Starkeya koreensis]|uniref:FUSC family protein n=1 Tax=Ancylobacter koreensis TaxID=266121 RepID=A0ABT0DQU7_9HYPH|nr:FUSC family protein [Ancylobacter koreensis]MCK0209559.1 FUSC family protein [Ancylobacter koreensis]
MERTAETLRPPSPWAGVFRQAGRDLLPFPGRFAMTWRVALLCALVTGVAMLYKVPESAISCYLIIFLMRPNGAESVGQAIGVTILISVVVLGLAPVIQATADNPFLRIAVIAGTSFGFLFLSSATQLGEIGAIIALVIAFVMTLVDQVPAGEVVTRGLLYAWQMAVMPMAMMLGFCLIFSTGPHTLLRATITRRLAAVAAFLAGEPDGRARLREELARGNEEAGKQAKLASLFHTAPTATVGWLAGAAASTYRLMLAALALPADASAERAALAVRCRTSAEAVAMGGRPMDEPGEGGDGPAAAAREALEALARPDGGGAVSEKPPFFAPDAFTNPDHQRFALKTTAAAITCYLIYSIIDWQGIHTALVTCYVAALGTTGETVRKLALRITGCLIGAALGLGSILLVIPHLESIGGLMALVFCAIMVAAWVSSGNERISYGGVQIGLAFLLTVLDGFGPSTDMDAARDRVVGILLGNLVIYAIFTQIWPKGAAVEVRERVAGALETLARLAALATPERARAVSEAARIEVEVDKAGAGLDLLPFEPAYQRPAAAELRRLRGLVAELRETLPALLFASELPPDTPERLRAAAVRVAGEGEAGPAEAGEEPDESASSSATGLALRLRRLETLAAG